MFSGIAKKLAKIAWKVSCHNHTTDLILITYKSWTLFAFNKCIPLSKHFNLCKANFMITNQPITIVFRAKKTTLVSQWLLIFQKNPSWYKMPWSHLEIDFFSYLSGTCNHEYCFKGLYSFQWFVHFPL